MIGRDGMRMFLFLAGMAAVACGMTRVAEAASKGARPRVVLETSMGAITLELDPDKAPATVENFLTYVREGYYDGLIFHRVIRGFMIQGGGFTQDMQPKRAGHPPIRNEAGNGLRNERGTIAMARTAAVDSATSQFFINTVDNDFLNHADDSPRGFGYAVFGRVVSGMDVVDRIEGVSTGTVEKFADVPTEAVTIVKAGIAGE
jgi:cyclophilin family peptidyl-prolyl cis-trans isomerase